MEKIKGNEPAMPRMAQAIGLGQDYFEIPAATGLTIRQHFAAMAMEGILSGGGTETNQSPQDKTPRWVAEAAVTYADALIAELNKPIN